ncbi:MAG TPA: hypothetical protein GXZ98_01220 [Firmicutes bacterium]|jgi:hypothetical protein|nr:hypothetical protein [Bacillota bacterium]
MKRLTGLVLVLVLVCLVAGPAAARDEVLISGSISHGGYGGPVIKVAPIKNETGIFVGGYGGWFINHCFLIGGGGYGLANDIKAPVTGDGEPRYYEMGYGGLVLEYVNNSYKLVHFTINTLIGAGGLGYRSNRERFSNEDTFFIIEPGINAELNVSSHFRVGLGVGYRYIDGIQLEGITEKDLNGMYASLTLKFGSF